MFFAWRTGRLGTGLQNRVDWFDSSAMLHFLLVVEEFGLSRRHRRPEHAGSNPANQTVSFIDIYHIIFFLPALSESDGRFLRAFSSVWLEHLSDTQEVGGSSPPMRTAVRVRAEVSS